MRTFDRLGLVEIEDDRRPGLDGQPLDYLDVTVNGVRLLPEVMRRTGEEVVGPFVHDWVSGTVVEVFERLLGGRPPELPGGRTWLYGCTVCGDIGCGAITIQLTFTPTTVRWTRMGYENDWEDGILHLETLAALDYTFDRTTYDAVLRPALNAWGRS